MKKFKYLNEETYQKGKGKISIISLVILFLGISLGGGLITLGIISNNEIKSNYSEESRAKLLSQLNEEKQKLEDKKEELQSKGIIYNSSTSYDDGESYELKIITNALDPSFDYCAFDEYKNNVSTTKYCSLKKQISDIDSKFNKNFELSKNTPLFMLGAFIIIASLMFSASFYVALKRREILAFTAQQVMPVAQEGLEKMAPTIGDITEKGMEKMTPVIGKMAKEITKGIKEGLEDKEK